MTDGFVRVLRLVEQKSEGGELVGGPRLVASFLIQPEFDQGAPRGRLVAQFAQAKKQLGDRSQILGIFLDRGAGFGEKQAKPPRFFEHVEIRLDQAGRPERLEFALIERERLGRVSATQFQVGSGGERVDPVIRKRFLVSGDLPLCGVELAVVAQVIEIPSVRLRFLRVARHPVAVSLVD